MFETATFFESMEMLCKKAYRNSEAHGFWDGPEKEGGSADNVSIPCKMLLLNSEVCELFEAYRKGKLTDPCGKDIQANGRRLTNEEEEIADILIRLADYCGKRNIDLGRVTLAKMTYNEARPFRHGKTC
jgi:NTP pyrophosphatase (non-canonical NTP hydrolase)